MNSEDRYVLRMEIDGGKAVQEIKNLQSHITKLRRTAKYSSKEQQDAIVSEINMYSQKQEAIRKAYNDEIANYQKLNSKIKEVKNNKETLLQTAMGDDVSAAQAKKLLAIYDALDKKEKEMIATNQKRLSSFKQASDGISGLTQKIERLKTEYKNLSSADAMGAKGTKLLSQIEEETGKLNVLKDALKGAEAVTSVDHLQKKLNAANQEVKNLSAKFDAMDKKTRRTGEGMKLKKKLDEAKESASKLSNELKKTEANVKKIEKGSFDLGKTFKTIFLQMGVGVLGWAQAFVALGNAVKSSITTAIEFNRTQSKLAAIFGTNVAHITNLTYHARMLGETTRYTSSQVGELQVNLARLGFAEGEIVNMTKAVLNFAQATGGDLAESAKVLGAVMKTYNLSAIHAAEAADAMALATSRSALSFEYIRTAIPIIGGTAQAYGFDLKDTLALVGALADTGMQASMAATAARNIILKLADPKSELNKLISKGFGKGQIKDVREFADALKYLKEQGIPLANILEVTTLRSTTAMASFIDKFRNIIKLREELEHADGAAERMAQTMEDNLGGSIKRLASAWQEFELALQGSQGTLRGIVDLLTQAVNIVSDFVNPWASAAAKKGVQRGMEISDVNSSQMKLWKVEDQKWVDDAMQNLLNQGYTNEDAITEVQEEFRKRIDKDKAEFHKDAEVWMESIKEIPEYKFAALYRDGIEGIGNNFKAIWKFATGNTKEYEKLSNYAEKEGMALAQEARWAQFLDMFGAYQPNKSYKDLGGKPGKVFVEMLTDLLKAKKIDRSTYLKALKDSPLGRKDTMETMFEDFIEQEEKYIVKLSQKLAKAKNMEDGLTLEIDGKIMTKQESIDYGNRAIAMHKGIIEMYKNSVIPNERNKYYKQEEIIALQESKKILEARMGSVRKGSKEEFALRRLLLENETALAIAQAEKEALLKENLTKEEQDQINKIRTDGLKEGLKMESLSAEEKALVDIIGEEGIKNGLSQEEVTNQQLEAVIAMRQQYKEMEFITKRIADNIKQINENSAKKSDKIRYDEESVIYADEAYARQAGKRRGLTPAQQAREEANLRVANAEAAVSRLKYGTPNQENSPEQTAAELAKAEEELFKAREELRAATMSEASERFNLTAQTTQNQLEQLQAVVDAKRAELFAFEQCNKLEGESDEARARKHAEIASEVIAAEKKLSDYRFNLAVGTATSIAGTFDTISQAIAASSEENEQNVKRSKILGLAAIYIQQAVAIAHAIRAASEHSITVWDLIANIATATTTVIASTAQAISAIKKAKFAKGGVDIQGKGTETSDSIPAMISKGESVMTARATKMFKPLLLAMNSIAAQPNVTLPTSYVGYNPVQTNATREQLEESFKNSVREIQPVVSVTEIERVSSRLSRVRVLDNI